MHHPPINDPQDQQYVWIMFTYKVHSVFSQPMEALEEEQQSEKGHKTGGKVVPEDCKG